MTGVTYSVTAAIATYWFTPSVGIPAIDTCMSRLFRSLLGPWFLILRFSSQKISDRFSQAAVLMFLGLFVLILTVLITGLWRHRTLTHSLLGLELFTLGMGVTTVAGFFCIGGSEFARWTVVWAVSGLFGYVLHLLEDAFTVSGVPLLFPWNKRAFGISPERYRIKTGSWVEGMFMVIVTTAFFFWLFG